MIDDRLRQAGQVPAWMNPRLMADTKARCVYQRYLVEILDVESELTRQLSVAPNSLHCVVGRPLARCVQIARHPLEPGVDVAGIDDIGNLRDGGESRVPHGLSMTTAKASD